MNKKHLILLILIAILLGGCSLGGQRGERPEREAEPTEEAEVIPSPTPAAVQPGVTILADGVIEAGTPTLSLVFETSGKIETIHVETGDLVEAGDLIATLDNTSAQEEVDKAQLNLQTAELALEDLKKPPKLSDIAAAESTLASAESNLASVVAPPDDFKVFAAEQNLLSAEQALQDLLDTPNPDQIQIAEANLATVELNLQAAQTAYNQVAHLGSVGATTEAKNLQEATINYERALAEYNTAIKGASDGDIAAARTRIAQAQSDLDTLKKGPTDEAVAAAEAQVKQAEASLAALFEGASAKDIETAQINVDQAQLTLTGAQRTLEKTELVAPTAGTITTVDVAAGTLIGSSAPVVTLLDLTQLEFHTTNVSERDLTQIFPGQTALVTLKAYPNDPIEATVVRVGLQTGTAVGDAATFPIILELNDTELEIRPGMTGRVDIRPKI
ncbi:MAG: efflux RND transporter periplasmic adaptor subunit [Chloroflexota bacterium]